MENVKKALENFIKRCSTSLKAQITRELNRTTRNFKMNTESSERLWDRGTFICEDSLRIARSSLNYIIISANKNVNTHCQTFTHIYNH